MAISPNLPLTEEEPVRPLSPYASSKLANEGYAAAFANTPGRKRLVCVILMSLARVRIPRRLRGGHPPMDFRHASRPGGARFR
jgi:hypothetical protein